MAEIERDNDAQKKVLNRQPCIDDVSQFVTHVSNGDLWSSFVMLDF